MAVRGSLLTFWMHVFINIPSDVELIVEQKFNFLIQKSIKVGLVKSFPATALQFFCQIYCKNFSFILWMMPMQRWWSSWWLQVCIDDKKNKMCVNIFLTLFSSTANWSTAPKLHIVWISHIYALHLQTFVHHNTYICDEFDFVWLLWVQ